MGTSYRAKVTRVEVEGIFVEIPSLNPGFEYGPCEFASPFTNLVAGDRVLVSYVGDIVDDITIIGKMTSVFNGTISGPVVFNSTATFNEGITVPSDAKNVKVGGTASPASFAAQRSLATDNVFSTRVAGDSGFNRMQIQADGKLQWGTAAAATDTNLYRSAADKLKTDDSFEAVGDFEVGGQALGIPRPKNHGAIAWTYDVTAVSTGTPVVNGTLYLVALYVNRSVSITKIFWTVPTIGAGAVAGQNFVGLYDVAGTLLASVDVSASNAFASAGQISSTFSAVALTPGLYWVAFLFNATTPPSIGRAGVISAGTSNFNVTGAAARFATNGALLTSLPASITPGSNVLIATTYWAAIG